MTSPAGLFCAHKRLRTSCPECRPPPPPPPPPKAKPARAAMPVETGADAEAEEGGATGRRGPGKPLMPVKKRVKAPTREEAEHAEAWWVKDRKP